MQKKIPYIRYTSRTFNSIKEDLVNYTKKYYPNTFQDFNEASFGSLMLDTVAYVGDIMSFYLDYQANESFLATALEYNNLVKLGASIGYRPKTTVSSTGIVTFYVSVPANSTGTDINYSYVPIIQRGTMLVSTSGITYTLVDDIYINEKTAEIRKSKLNDRAPYEYVAKVRGRVISGTETTTTVELGAFEKFKKIRVGDSSVSEIISVTDSDGNQYYEVDYLTQNVIYKDVLNGDKETNKETLSIIKPFAAVRRFIVIREELNTYIQFGGGVDSKENINNNKVLDPSSVILEKYGKNYTSDESFDPTILVTNDKLGVAPHNTIMSITYRYNPTDIASSPKDSINQIVKPLITFADPNMDNLSVKNNIASSITVTNELPIVGQTDDFTSDELRNKIYGSFSSQNRAVTEADYKALCYSMPEKYGNVKRVSIVRDVNELKRNINLYVISQDSYGELLETNKYTKNNLKTWLNKSKMINDTIDILDAKIVNFGIYFSGIVDKSYNKYSVLSEALSKLEQEFSVKMDIGEYIHLSRIYEALRNVDGLLDVRTIELIQKYAGLNEGYSQYTFNFSENMTRDGMFLKVPKNVIMEIKNPKTDIEGKII